MKYNDDNFVQSKEHDLLVAGFKWTVKLDLLCSKNSIYATQEK